MARASGVQQGRAGLVAGAIGALCLLFLGASLLAFPGRALAQQGTSGLYWQCAPVDSTHPNGGYCPVSAAYPAPVGPGILALTPVAGTQTNLTISAATGLTVPAGATVALIQAQGTNNTSGQCLFWQDDGTAPTGSTGQALPAYQDFYYKATGPIKLIAASGATCTATISYYK